MRIGAFHLMPWPYQPEDFRERESSAWVTYSNSNYDPQLGHDLYERYLTELVHAGDVGFDTLCVNEHHQTSYGLMPAPNLIAMALVQRTLGRDTRIAVVGNALPLRENPARLAEELAILDVMSAGRIDSGFVRGIGAEYHSFGTNPADSESRFREAHDLILDAWTKAGPINWDGEHYHIPYVNPWPRPYQQPHPPIWITTSGTGSTVKWAAERRYTMIQTATLTENVVTTMNQYRATARECGYEPDPQQLGLSLPIYIGKDDDDAYERYSKHVDYLYNFSRHRPPPAFMPPGYISPSGLKAMMAARARMRSTAAAEMTAIETALSRDDGIIGGPETVVRKLRETIDRTGIGCVLLWIHTGTMSHEETLQNIDRMGEHILPALKDYLPEAPEDVAVTVAS